MLVICLCVVQRSFSFWQYLENPHLGLKDFLYVFLMLPTWYCVDIFLGKSHDFESETLTAFSWNHLHVSFLYKLSSFFRTSVFSSPFLIDFDKSTIYGFCFIQRKEKKSCIKLTDCGEYIDIFFNNFQLKLSQTLLCDLEFVQWENF